MPTVFAAIEASMVVRSIGYRGEAIVDLPFDEDAATVPNDDGRVLGADGTPVDRVYVTGWIKRGPRGVIGTNRACAKQTVKQLWSDHDAGRLRRDAHTHQNARGLLTERGITTIDWDGWRRIDATERGDGAATGRPRRKITSRPDLVAIASPESRDQ